MSTQKVVERILSDANAAAQATVGEAERKAAETLANASARAERSSRETEREVQAKIESIYEKRAADARLESAKILLAEKRKAVDAVYALALGRLISLDKEESLALCASLLETYAEKGDEVFFAANFKYADEVAKLPVISQKALKVSKERLPLDGGMKLIGKTSDKDLSYAAILSADRDENESDLAAELFK